MGTWKLNEAKSKLAAGAPKNNTVVWESSGDTVKITADGMDATGKPTHVEWAGKLDGKDYPVIGAPNSDARSYFQQSKHHIRLKAKKGGKVTTTGVIYLSPDGKTRTVTTTTTDDQGKKVKSTAVYDKE